MRRRCSVLKRPSGNNQDQTNFALTDQPVSRLQLISGASPSLKENPRAVNGALSLFSCHPRGALGQVQQRFFEELCKEARKRGYDFTAMGPTNADPSVIASLRAGASWANRNFPAWAKQTISFAVRTSKAPAVDRILRNGKETNLSHRGLGVTRRSPGAVGHNANTPTSN